jgi:hypothetical protein
LDKSESQREACLDASARGGVSEGNGLGSATEHWGGSAALPVAGKQRQVEIQIEWALEQRHAADAQLACLSCKAILWRRFVRAADAQRYALSPTQRSIANLRLAESYVSQEVKLHVLPILRCCSDKRDELLQPLRD